MSEVLKNLCLALCEAFGIVSIISIISYIFSICIGENNINNDLYDPYLVKLEKWVAIIALTIFIISLVTYYIIQKINK